MLGAAAGILFGVSDVAIKAISGMVGSHGVIGLAQPVDAGHGRRLGRRLLQLGQGPAGRRRRPGHRRHRHRRQRRRDRRRDHRVRRSAVRPPVTLVAECLAFALVLVAAWLTPAPVRAAQPAVLTPAAGLSLAPAATLRAWPPTSPLDLRRRAARAPRQRGALPPVVCSTSAGSSRAGRPPGAISTRPATSRARRSSISTGRPGRRRPAAPAAAIRCPIPPTSRPRCGPPGVSDGRPVVVYDGASVAGRGPGLVAAALLRPSATWRCSTAGWPPGRRPARAAAPAGGERRPAPATSSAGPGGMPVLDAEGAAALARGRRAARRAGRRALPRRDRAGRPGGRSHPRRPQPPDDREPAAADGRFLDPAALREAFAAPAGPGETAEVGAYCGSGITAAHQVLALELAGLRGGAVPGSWSDWVERPGRAVARLADARDCGGRAGPRAARRATSAGSSYVGTCPQPSSITIRALGISPAAARRAWRGEQQPVLGRPRRS